MLAADEAHEFIEAATAVVSARHRAREGRADGIEVTLPIPRALDASDGEARSADLYQGRQEALEAAGLPE